MSYTIAEKILKSHSAEDKVVPGQYIEAKIDLIMVHEQLGGRIHKEYEKLGLNEVWDPNKIFFILDHWVPAPSVSAAQMHKDCRNFAKKYNFIHNIGMNKGICHQVLPELGFSRPGMLIVGSDSHTTTYGAFNCLATGIGASDVVMVFATGLLWFKIPETFKINLSNKLCKGVMAKDFILTFIGNISTKGALYKSLEFHGKGIENLSIDSRMTISNMVVEAGAKFGVFLPDKNLENWLSKRTNKHYKMIKPDEDAEYEQILEYDLSKIYPVVAKPSNPGNLAHIEEVEGLEIDQAFLGSCTNGRMEDLRIAAQILKGNKIKSNIRMIITPASTEIYLNALEEGLIEIFLKSGAILTNSTCGACIGGHLGVLGENEICISSTNRNFTGRMGDPTSQIYLASPATVAASALQGKISDPREVL
ncbi:MAG: 3-isopropylmalate dehydratase large subunit [Promethearchaeota archaeon]|nr:MAG: 3-isopropylmalate dehydratase large subunit [Candidatus Lokiarchaeota archaeon]